MQVELDLEKLYGDHLETVKSRLDRVLDESGKDGIIVPSGRQKETFLDDHVYPFVVNPHFKAWLPLTNISDSFLLIRRGEQPILLYNQPEDYWHKAPADPQGYWVRHWDIQSIASPRDVHNLIGDASQLVYIGEETDQAEAWGIDAINPAHVLAALHYDRAYKTKYELACMQMANLAAARGHRAAEAAFRAGKSEFDIQHAYLHATAEREREAPYSGIVALNENCAVLHYQYYEKTPPNERRSMLIDAGANFHGYAADVTRTYAWNDDEFAALLRRMNHEQLGIVEDIVPGMNYADLHLRMNHRLANVLKDFDIVRMSPDTMVEENVTFTFLPHGLGHLLGLQTHDVAGFQQDRKGATQAAPEQYPALRLTRPIEDNQVFTIEPGLYFIPMLLRELKAGPHSAAVNWNKIDSLVGHGGIRIEDNVAIINGEPVNLTRDAFASVADD